jgi:mRNA-degrading endonuclease toxin of MazEF toxin-antitoxin module
MKTTLAPARLSRLTVRSISSERLVVRWGAVRRDTMTAVEDRLRILLGL